MVLSVKTLSVVVFESFWIPLEKIKIDVTLNDISRDISGSFRYEYEEYIHIHASKKN
jgi:hypothetical protein